MDAKRVDRGERRAAIKGQWRRRGLGSSESGVGLFFNFFREVCTGCKGGKYSKYIDLWFLLDSPRPDDALQARAVQVRVLQAQLQFKRG